MRRTDYSKFEEKDDKKDDAEDDVDSKKDGIEVDEEKLYKE
jgi:hypothetical protein